MARFAEIARSATEVGKAFDAQKNLNSLSPSIDSAPWATQRAVDAQFHSQTAERVLSATYRAVDVGYSAIVNKQFGPPFFESGWGTFPIRGFGQEATFMRESVADPTTSVRIDWRRGEGRSVMRGTGPVFAACVRSHWPPPSPPQWMRE